LAAVISYLGWHDIEIVPSKLKRMVTIPKVPGEPEHAIDVTDIRLLLHKCNNQRLKTYLLMLGSGGMRTIEALATRIKDIDFNTKPTTIHIRGQFSKTKRARDIFISDEATEALKDRIKLKYKDRPRVPDDLVFHQWRPRSENS
jgi:integrase